MGTLHELRIPPEDYILARLEVIAPSPVGPRASDSLDGFAWVSVMGEARANSRPLGRYLALMAVAGVIASLGVITDNAILIVGAMALSPDLLPIVAIAVGVIGRKPGLARTALLSLVVGLALACLAAAIFAFAQDQLDLLPSGFNLHKTGILGGLVDVNDETIVVAFVAGAAGMLAFETRAVAAVGVAISVTTIPAAAYLGVAAGLGELTKSLGALGVLSANVTMMVLGASLILWAQRWRDRREVAR
jgi:uncharacterized hydrophobic protein (TIGR00271 family)